MRLLRLFPFRASVGMMLLVLMVGLTGIARAQNAPRIVYPQEGQAVRGQITIRFENLPEGGYLIIKVDDQFKTASTQPTYTLNTFLEFPNEGTHRLSVSGVDASGRNVGSSEVSFEVANSRVDPTQTGVLLRHWTLQDRLNENVQRYRVFAQSDASISGGDSGGGAGGGGGGAGGGDSDENWIPAPLDWQISALVRRIVRDVGMVDGAANIRYVLAQEFQRQRLSEGQGAGGAKPATPATGKRKKKKKGGGGPTKAPWNYEDVRVTGTHNKFHRDLWDIGAELGQYNVKMILATGSEINATRKAPTLALADLLPTFPQEKVFPGSTWLTSMTFVGDLSTREPVNVRDAPMSFSNFDTVITPAGQKVRCAKLESYFNLPDNEALQLAGKLSQFVGSAGGAGGGGGAGAKGAPNGGAAGAASQDPDYDPTEDIGAAHTKMSRVLWFDITGRRIVRAEDTINTSFEILPDEDDDEGGGGGAAGGAAAAPTTVSYTLHVTTYLDDNIPDPTPNYLAGIGTAHAPAPGTRDRSPVQEPTLAKARRP